MTPLALRRIIQKWDTGTGFDDAVGLFAKEIGRHRRTVQRWLAGEYEIDPPMAAYIRSFPKNAKPVKQPARK